MTAPLDGITVVALEQYIAGPYCTSLLADAGADVVKVERPGTGDPRRGYEPARTDGTDRVSSGFVSYNRGKRSAVLDLRDPAGRDDLLALVATADVLVANLRPGALAGLGLDAATLRRANPRLVVCEITGFGTTGGPYGDWPAFDSVIQAMSGLSSLLGDDPDGPPGLAPMATMDLLAGTYAALGICMALVRRGATGAGSHLDVAMYDVGVAFLERPLTLQEFTGRTPTRGLDEYSPVAVFRCGDGGWVALVIPTDEMWRRCCLAIDRPELEHDERLDSVLKRSAAMRSVLVPAFEAWAADLTRDEAAERLRRTGQPAGVVQTIDEVRRCAHLAHRGLFVDVPDPASDVEGEPLRLPRMPIRFDDHETPGRRSPRLGEHTDDVLEPLQARRRGGIRP